MATDAFTIALGKRIVEERIKKGLSQSELGAIIDIEKPNLSNIENGKKDIAARTLIKIARGLNVCVDDLVKDLPLHG